jgi:hypothetical protein
MRVEIYYSSESDYLLGAIRLRAQTLERLNSEERIGTMNENVKRKKRR